MWLWRQYVYRLGALIEAPNGFRQLLLAHAHNPPATHPFALSQVIGVNHGVVEGVVERLVAHLRSDDYPPDVAGPFLSLELSALPPWLLASVVRTLRDRTLQVPFCWAPPQ